MLTRTLSIAVLLPLLHLLPAAQETKRFDLEGLVVDTYGTAIPDATILVYTAKPREGYSPL